LYRAAVNDCLDYEADGSDFSSIEKSTPILPPINTLNITGSPTAQPIKSKGAASDNPSPTIQHDHTELQKQWQSKKETDLSETQKLQVIIEEFGEISTLMENLDGTDGPPERILAESHGSLYR
jgi:hypothetical protein